MFRVIVLLILVLMLNCFGLVAKPDIPDIFYKKNIEIGGTLNSTLNFNDKISSWGFNLGTGPRIGYFLIDQLQLNISILFNYSFTKDNFPTAWRRHNYYSDINLFPKYYFII